MGWMERFSLVMRSSVTVLQEKVADPERLLHQLIIDMEAELETIRRSVAEAIADEILLKKRWDKARTETDEWLTRAKSALQRGDESGAQAALEQKGAAMERADQFAAEHAKQKDQTERLRQSVRDLEEKVREARQRRTLLLARMTRATSSRRINAALDRVDCSSAFAEFNRLESRVEREEAVSEAYDRMDGRDPDAEALERKFAEAARKEKLQKEFEELKQRVEPAD